MMTEVLARSLSVRVVTNSSPAWLHGTEWFGIPLPKILIPARSTFRTLMSIQTKKLAPGTLFEYCS